MIAGIDWVTAHHLAAVAAADGAPVPAVANMSLGGGASDTMDAAVAGSIDSGVVYAVAAGNAYGDACEWSPARASRAITVGATGVGSDPLADVAPVWSNQGACVDILAPGSAIVSDWNADDSAISILSGTSMATPHVAGATAMWLQLHPSAPPEMVERAFIGNATLGRVTNLETLTPNMLLYDAFIAEDAWDMTPPSALVTAPVPGTTVTGEVQLAADAHDDTGGRAGRLRRRRGRGRAGGIVSVHRPVGQHQRPQPHPPDRGHGI